MPNWGDAFQHGSGQGNSQLSGIYTGYDEIVGFFTRAMELSASTFTIHIDDLFTSTTGRGVVHRDRRINPVGR